MTDDARLTDFVGGDDAEPAADGESDDEGGLDGGGSADEREDDVDGSAPVEPPTVTTGWTPSGAACEACGREVARRWRGEAGWVCADCKAW